MNGTPVNDCSGTFYDPGGEAGGYGNNQNLTTTILLGWQRWHPYQAEFLWCRHRAG
jgi:hypothetical protein